MIRRTILLLLAASLVIASGCGRSEEPPAKAGTRFILFGIDSLNWNVLTPMIEAGELPTIARLTREGSFGILKTGTPIQSPQMWTSVATGVVPEKHGITGFVAEIPGTDREVPVTSNMRKVKAFWNILSDRGLSVGVVGWWPSWPAEKVNGFIVAQRAWPVNWSQHGIPFGAARDASGRLLVQDFPGRTYPEDLYKDFERFIVTEEDVTPAELSTFFGDSRFTDPSRQFHARWVYAKDKTFADGGLAFLKRFNPDVFAVYFQGTDVVSHYYWGYQTDMGYHVSPEDAAMYGHVVRSYYHFIDSVIGRYLDAVGDSCAVMVVGDHGFETKPDLKVRWERGEKVRTVEGGKDVPWDHGIDGAYIFRGPGVRAAYRGEDASVVDVTPTMLAYLGLPVARDMDGSPMVDVLTDPFLKAHPIQYIDTYETGEPRGDQAPLESPMDEGLKEKLRALGYIN
jgi:predicted AlkP superfamily pyrophosphatase or phosphodiesterase